MSADERPEASSVATPAWLSGYPGHGWPGSPQRAGFEARHSRDPRRRRSTNVSDASRTQPVTWSMSELYYRNGLIGAEDLTVVQATEILGESTRTALTAGAAWLREGSPPDA